jgi:acetyl-CoA C-acetyltransferase
MQPFRPSRKAFVMAQLSPADPIVILSYARTPMGGMQGVFSDVAATDLGATAIRAAVERAGVDGAEIERVYMGCVLPAGLGQAPCPSRSRRPRSTRSADRGCRR